MSVENGPRPNNLLITGEGISDYVSALGQSAKEMAVEHKGYLTDAEVELLQNVAQFQLSNPDLPPADAAALSKWLEVIAKYPQDPSKIHEGKGNLTFLSHGGDNPYLHPGVMAILAPILSELGEITNQISLQSSKMQQAMMGLIMSMAKQAYNNSIQAGEARAKQLEADAQMHMTMAISAAVQIVSLAVTYAITTVKLDRAKSSYDTDKKTLVGEDKSDRRQDYHDQRQDITRAESMVNNITQQVGNIINNAISSATETAKVQLTKDAAFNEAMEKFLSQLQQIVSQTMNTAQQEGQSASRIWQGLNQLFKDFSNTITRSMYQG